MSTAIVRQEQVVSSLDDVQRVARLLAASNYFDAKGDGPLALAQIATKILAGREMGYGPFASVQGIHVIQGKPVISANLMAAAVKRSGRYDYRVTRLDDTGCELVFYDGGREVGRSSFTAEDAGKAQVAGKDNWKKFPRNMYFARAMSNGVRWYCPDVFGGTVAYTPDELGAIEDADGHIVDVPATKPAQPARAVAPACCVYGHGSGRGLPRQGQECAFADGFPDPLRHGAARDRTGDGRAACHAWLHAERVCDAAAAAGAIRRRRAWRDHGPLHGARGG